ncbi:hypothetical protein E3N88_19673 [Mikania micrantha]|uniref:DNL-type domain-containing protein n=1 Tax=Mikania micrantha TaxID=192012 RepID=A0A5N6NS02_9ASTR|nr:hypothetical protein E3N88_19673 [Mikania micrantha]
MWEVGEWDSWQPNKLKPTVGVANRGHSANESSVWGHPAYELAHSASWMASFGRSKETRRSHGFWRNRLGLGISYAKRKGSKHVVISCLVKDNSNSGSIESNPGATIDLKLPRRSLLVQFTCNACGVRSQKLINRLAYEKGMVFVQCTGCSQYHKLVDNLNLVVEYDFREEINTSADADQV